MRRLTCLFNLTFGCLDDSVDVSVKEKKHKKKKHSSEESTEASSSSVKAEKKEKRKKEKKEKSSKVEETSEDVAMDVDEPGMSVNLSPLLIAYTRFGFRRSIFV